MKEKFSSFRLLAIGLLAAALMLGGCSDGSDGTPGLAGVPGADGADGADGRDGIVSPSQFCAMCHTTVDASILAQKPFANEIAERFDTSRHANQRARAGICSSCHSHEGGVEFLAMGRMTSHEDLEKAYTAETSKAFSIQAAELSTKNCTTCHSSSTAHFVENNLGLRGDGDILATSANVDGFPVQATPTAIDNEIRVVYSAEFNLCTACHMVDLTARWDATAGSGGRGMITYELSDAYTATKLLEDGSVTFDRSRVFYHDGASGNTRTFIDTHFAGTVHSQYVNFDGKIDPVEVVGYNINPGYRNACTICHDAHTGGKLIAKEDGAFPGANAEAADNPVIAYAQGVGTFHANYLGNAMSRNMSNASCVPCHTGDGFTRQIVSGKSQQGVANERWNVIGCRACHDLAQPNAAPSQNNHEAFAKVREFPAGYEFSFNSGETVTRAQLGASAICFECHKGRTPSNTNVNELNRALTTPTNGNVIYLHYAPSAAILFGDDSGMIDGYDGKTYAGRFVHTPVPGITNTGCIDCHDAHTGDNIMGTASNCMVCHSTGNLSIANLQARVDLQADRLIETIANVLFNYDIATVPATSTHHVTTGTGTATLNNTALIEFLTDLQNETNASERFKMTKERIKNRNNTLPNGQIAYAAAIWRTLMYEDGRPGYTGGGHGGSWAHNSHFTRQLLFDAIEDLGGSTTGIGGRP